MILDHAGSSFLGVPTLNSASVDTLYMEDAAEGGEEEGGDKDAKQSSTVCILARHES